MTPDLAHRLRNLQESRALDDIDEDAYERSLAKLRAAYGEAAVNTLLHQPAPVTPSTNVTLTVQGNARVASIHQGDHYGHTFIYGQHTKSAEQLLADYLQRLIQHCGSLPMQGIREQKAVDDVLTISLDQVYTQLIMTGLTEWEPDKATQTYRFPSYNPQYIGNAIVANDRLVLLGEPGSGKSTGLSYLALTFAQAYLDETVNLVAKITGWRQPDDGRKFLPLLMPLLPFAKEQALHLDRPATADDFWNHLAAHLEGGGRYIGLAAAFHDELQAGRVLLLLDGLDEVVGTDSRHAVIQAVDAFGSSYRRCRIVVTCRVRAYEGQQNQAWRLPGWATATLAEWTITQMHDFVTAWYRATAKASGMTSERRDERTAVLRRAITTRIDLQRLGTRPLLLTMMALVHFNDGRLPEERVELYSRCIDLLLGQWELAREDGSGYGTLMDYIGLPDIDLKSMRPLLEMAAFMAHAAGTHAYPGSLRRDTLQVLVADALRKKGHADAWNGAQRFLEYTDFRAGLLQAHEAGETYVFPFLTLQEYLAGRELVRDVNFVQRILEYRNNDHWRIPILLGVGHLVSEGALAMPYQLLSELLWVEGRTMEQTQRDILFAAEISEDVGWDRLERGGASLRKLRSDLAHALVGVIEETVLPGKERVRAGVYLGTLGDPRPGVCTLPPAMIPIDSGSFMIGELPETPHSSDEYNDELLILPAFEIARYQITNAQYALFIADDGYNANRSWWDETGCTWLTRNGFHHPSRWTDERFGINRPNHPVIGVTMYEAQAFSRWLTQQRDVNPRGYYYHLPSEAEWEYTARSSQRRRYPWGKERPSYERANYEGYYQGTTAVGCFPGGATPEGVCDLAGNIWEWTSSVYAPYPYDPTDGREQPDVLAQKRFTLRGGGWINNAINLRSTKRFSAPAHHSYDVGFRLVRHLHKV